MGVEKFYIEPSQYSRTNRIQKAMGFQMLAENYSLINSLPYPVRALDVGCGSGNVTRLLTNFSNVAEVTGLDFNKEMIKYADNNNGEQRIMYGFANIEEYETFPLGINDRFDLAISFVSIHWPKNTCQALENVKKCLKPGGFLMGYTLARQPPAHAAMLKYLHENVNWTPYYLDFVEESEFGLPTRDWMFAKDPAVDFTDKMQKSGYVDVECKVVHSICRFTIEEIRGYVPSFLKIYLTHIPKDLHEEFINCCVAAFLNSTQMVKNPLDGSYARTDERLDFFGRRPSEF